MGDDEKVLIDISLTKEEIAGILLNYVRQCSEDRYCASWLTDIEYEIFNELFPDGIFTVHTDNEDNLYAYLAKKADIWFYWDDESYEPKRCSLVEFQEMANSRNVHRELGNNR